MIMTAKSAKSFKKNVKRIIFTKAILKQNTLTKATNVLKTINKIFRHF